MADKAFITPNVLRWARESARMSPETAAKKVTVDVEKLIEWEEGTKQPTINQAQLLAKAYKRPFALFFLPEIPRDFMPLQDFRRPTANSLETASIFIIREIQERQAWISDVFQENNESSLPFVGKFSISSNPQEVAEDIINTLQISPGNYSSGNPIKEWIEKAELKGIFISRTSFINSKLTLNRDELQGFAIADPFAPFIFINSHDWLAPQLFTLVHELAHIWIAASGISNEVDLDIQQRDQQNPIELFCNEVAANALMPLSIMRSFQPSDFIASEKIYRTSKSLGVSTFAFLVRALNMNIIGLETYQELKADATSAFESFILNEERKKQQQKLKGSGPNYYQLLVNKNSHLFTRIVMDAFRGGIIKPTLASNLLNTKVNNFTKLESFLH